MIYYDTIFPNQIKGEQLDRYLAAGWYRIGQRLSTTDLVSHEGTLVPVFWLRIRLADFQPSRSARRIWRRCRTLKSEVLPFAITREIESLYRRYRNAISHRISSSIWKYLLDEEAGNTFDSWRIEVRDGKHLVAVAYFDQGAKSTAGILHIYDPHYAKISPGKLLYLETIHYSIAQGHLFYYPGYISPAMPKFDYKLFADTNSAEIYLRLLQRWVPYGNVARKLPVWSRRLTEVINKAQIPEIVLRRQLRQIL